MTAARMRVSLDRFLLIEPTSYRSKFNRPIEEETVAQEEIIIITYQ